LTLTQKSLELPPHGRFILPLPPTITAAVWARTEIVATLPCAVDILLTPEAGRGGGAAAPALVGGRKELYFTLLTFDEKAQRNWLTLANRDPAARNQVTIDFFQGDGELLLSRTLELAPNGTVTRELRELAGSQYPLLRYRDVWLRVRGSGPLCGLQSYAADSRTIALRNPEPLR
jgi:hypothetical protein